jgi:hypothetical protein
MDAGSGQCRFELVLYERAMQSRASLGRMDALVEDPPGSGPDFCPPGENLRV